MSIVTDSDKSENLIYKAHKVYSKERIQQGLALQIAEERKRAELAVIDEDEPYCPRIEDKKELNPRSAEPSLIKNRQNSKRQIE